MADTTPEAMCQPEEMGWLIEQLNAWPTRVHMERTTNVTFLMQAAGATLTALSAEVERLGLECGAYKHASEVEGGENLTLRAERDQACAAAVSLKEDNIKLRAALLAIAEAAEQGWQGSAGLARMARAAAG